jgi:hypothetical protein
MNRIFTISFVSAPALAVMITLAPSAVVGGNVPESKKAVISKMSCGDLASLLKNLKSRKKRLGKSF